MPRAPKKCGSPGCEARVVGRSYCLEHTVAWLGSNHPSSTRASRAKRAIVLKRDPTCRCPGCAACSTGGCDRASTDDDHIVPLHLGGSDDLSNRAGKCRQCHAVKTLGEARAARAARSR